MTAATPEQQEPDAEVIGAWIVNPARKHR